MPATRALGKIPAVDLAYAVDRLIQEGKTSLAEVRKRQGQYLAALKRLKGVERARVKTVARKEGVAKAIELARKRCPTTRRLASRPSNRRLRRRCVRAGSRQG